LTAAADEMNDLKPVAIVNGSRVPAGAWDDVAIEFNGNAIRLRPEVLDERRKRRQFRKFLFFAVDMKAHE
jgi:hypothetical protein